jgi:multidrug resistance efflux pump
MLTTSLLLALALSADPAPAAGDPQIPICEIASIDEQAVPGADAGVLMLLTVKEGMRVTKGMEVGRIDDSAARAQLAVKQFEYDVTNQTANSDIDIRHAKAAAAVAKAAYDKLEESNRIFKGTVTAIDILRARLEWKKSELAIEQVAEKQIEAQLTSKAKSAEVGAAKVALERHVLRAPFDGVVVKVAKKPGEWVAPGEAVVHLVGIDRLRVMGNLDATDWGPADIDGRKVTVEVALPRGRSARVTGKVTYVSPVVTLGRLSIWATIDAPLQDEIPVVRAGLQAAMTIHVNQPVAAKAPTQPVGNTSTKSASKQ